MKTLVLGASGFIGSAFLKQDLKENIEIVTRNKSLSVTKYKKHIGDIKDKDFLENLAKQNLLERAEFSNRQIKKDHVPNQKELELQSKNW